MTEWLTFGEGIIVFGIGYFCKVVLIFTLFT